MRPVGFFTWNSQSFAERWARRAGMAGMALARPFAYTASRTFATRFLHTCCAGQPRPPGSAGRRVLSLRFEAAAARRSRREVDRSGAQRGARRPRRATSGEHTSAAGASFRSGVVHCKSNGYRDGKATGRLIDPIVRPRGPLAWLASGGSDGRIAREKLPASLGGPRSPSNWKARCRRQRRSHSAGQVRHAIWRNSASQETFCPGKPGKAAFDANRSDGIYRQGLAR